ncbi:MAG: hypothetical protein ABSA18_02825 [Dehalococcoidia bacterium]|jgi:hypothetical protein
MTPNEPTADITSGGLLGNVDIGTQAGQTADVVLEKDAESDTDYLVTKSSELTSDEYAPKLSSSHIRASERNALMTKYRAAQASAFFDPEAMALLERLTEKELYDFRELADKFTTIMWVKLAILIRAYLVEPLDNGVIVTPEGYQALIRVKKYLSTLDTENHLSQTEKER